MKIKKEALTYSNLITLCKLLHFPVNANQEDFYIKWVKFAGRQVFILYVIVTIRALWQRVEQ